MKLTLGFSPCPNDTFIFDALVNKKIDTEGFDFDVYLEDVQTLNRWALEGRLDVSKISYGVLPLVLDQYDYLSSGGALGKGVGPLLIARSPIPQENIPNCTIAIPGENTTAHLLFSQAFPKAKNKVFRVFNQIEEDVLSGKIDAGVIIHENRFTYQQKGLHKIIDLGDYWEQTTGLPIPLGGIVAKRSLGVRADQLGNLIRASVEYAFKHHHKQLSDYVKQYAQEMSEDVMRQHVDLYVNEYSIELGERGEQAITQLLKTFAEMSGSII